MKIIKISALWCPGCLIINNIFGKIKKEYPNIEIINYDYDFDEEEVSSWNVGKTLPVLIFVDDDMKEITRLIGEKTKDEIEEVIKKYE